MKLASAGLAVISMIRCAPMMLFIWSTSPDGTLVAPNDGIAQHIAVFIQHNKAVHLAGKANALDILPLLRRWWTNSTESPLWWRSTSQPGPALPSRSAAGTTGYSMVLEQIALPSASNRTVLVPEVPRSTPNKYCISYTSVVYFLEAQGLLINFNDRFDNIVFVVERTIKPFRRFIKVKLVGHSAGNINNPLKSL